MKKLIVIPVVLCALLALLVIRSIEQEVRVTTNEVSEPVSPVDFQSPALEALAVSAFPKNSLTEQPTTQSTQAKPAAHEPLTMGFYERMDPEVRDTATKLAHRDGSDLVAVPNPEGGLIIDMKGRFRHVPVAVINSDGTVSVSEF